MRFEVMDRTGHSTLEFGPADDEVKRAMEVFDELVGRQKMLAATREVGASDYDVAKNFSDLKAETLFRPQVTGG